MAPADQCFGAVDAVGRGVHFRLVVKLELLPRQRFVQIAFQLDPLARDSIHPGLEALDAVAAALLGAVHRRIGMGDQGFRRAAIARVEGYADAAGGTQVDARDPDRGGQRLDRSLGELDGSLLLRQRVDDEHELIAAHARDRVHVPHHAAQAPRDFVQQLVAGAVTERIVDLLEAV